MKRTTCNQFESYIEDKERVLRSCPKSDCSQKQSIIWIEAVMHSKQLPNFEYRFLNSTTLQLLAEFIQFGIYRIDLHRRHFLIHFTASRLLDDWTRYRIRFHHRFSFEFFSRFFLFLFRCCVTFVGLACVRHRPLSSSFPSTSSVMEWRHEPVFYSDWLSWFWFAFLSFSLSPYLPPSLFLFIYLFIVFVCHELVWCAPLHRFYSRYMRRRACVRVWERARVVNVFRNPSGIWCTYCVCVCVCVRCVVRVCFVA